MTRKEDLSEALRKADSEKQSHYGALLKLAEVVRDFLEEREGDSGDFAYITHPQARAWAQANAGPLTALIRAVTGAIGAPTREALAVITWVAVTGYPGDGGQQLREIHFQVMARRSTPCGRETSEALDRVLARHLPFPAEAARGEV